jgi:hypothetical protein
MNNPFVPPPYKVLPHGEKFIVVGPNSNDSHALDRKELAEYVASSMNIAYISGAVYGVDVFIKKLKEQRLGSS